jgi:hypothetical protein
MKATPWRAALSAFGIVLGLGTQARAADVTRVSPQIGATDGAYGRFTGDVESSGGVGVEVQRGAPRLDVRLEAHYFWSAGVYAHFSQSLTSNSEPQVVGAGVNLRPAFLPRFGLDLEQGPARLDLFVDSISLSFGGYWGSQGSRGFNHTGFEAALSAAFPLLPAAQGPWLEGRVGARWADTGNAGRSPFTAGVLLCYRWLWLSPLAP